LKGLPEARNFLTSGRTETASNNVATQVASSTPLPTQLAGTSVKVRNSAGVERFAPLFFVSPTQINYQLPPGTGAGLATITVTNASGNSFVEQGIIFTTNPGLFTAGASGAGLASAVVLRVKAGGAQSFEPVARFDSAQNKFVAAPIDLGPATDQVFLILFGTGIRNHSASLPVTAQIGGVNAPVSFAGAQGELVGLDQVNVQLPRSLSGRGEVDIVLTVDLQTANTVRAAFQ